MFNFLKNTSYTFEGKKDEESVVLFLHRHWYVLTGKITTILIMSLVPILLLIVFGQLILSNNLIPLFTFLWASYIMALWYYLFYVLTMYTLDYWIVTNERIVNNIQRGFFNRSIAELSIHMIQDVSVKLVGMIPTMLNFGSVEVQTAAEEGHFKLQDVPKPQSVKDKVMEIIEETESELGPRMHGMTQRHHFHPDKYVIQRISEETKNKLPETDTTSDVEMGENNNEGFFDNKSIDTVSDEGLDKETQLKRQIEWQEQNRINEDNTGNNAPSKSNFVPPNLPL
ncbi:MAG: PH domain-containing protein [Candidatus Pacebacteria bacterium]|nr:PH domain-containing protein [Candidatus Paceibacterota bacterium]